MTDSLTKIAPPVSPSPAIVATEAGITKKAETDFSNKPVKAERRTWKEIVLCGRILWVQVERDRTFTQAAALTYKTLFSLLPILVLAFLVLGMLSSASGDSALDVNFREQLFKQMALDKMPVTNGKGEQATNPETGNPMTAAELISPLIDRAKASVSGKATGLIAFGILLYGSLTLMIVIESTFNQMFGAVKPRSWPRRIMLYWCVLTLGPIGVAASTIAGQTMFTTARTLAGTATMVPIHILSGVAMSTLLLLLMYKLIPDTKVQWRSALIGAFAAAVIWQIEKEAFGMYVIRAVRHSVYGSLALIPLFMMLVYLTWTAVLLGLQFAYIHQFFPLLEQRLKLEHRRAPVFADIRWAIALGVLLERRFEHGKGVHTHEAAHILMLPGEAVEQLLEGFLKAGIVHVTRHDGYALARPAASISAVDLLTVARHIYHLPTPTMHIPGSDGERPIEIAMMPVSLENMERNWAESRTLADLAAGR